MNALRRIANDQKIVARTPILTALLLEGANVGQLIRMWRVGSALGQSAASWAMVNLALWLWWNYYRVFLPGEKFARYATSAGIVLNGCVLATTLYFRYMWHSG